MRLHRRLAQRACLMGYQALIADLHLPDPDDRHVLAAAIHCDANVIVTFNLRDFPHTALASYGIQAQHPDDFMLQLLERDATAVLSAAPHQRAQLVHPSMDIDGYLHILHKQGLKKTVETLMLYRNKL